MDFRKLEYFVTVVDCGSISAAAQKLLVAQPSLSRTIHTMERQMNRQLLEQTGRGVSPTDAGQHLYYYARPFWTNSRCWNGCPKTVTHSW